MIFLCAFMIIGVWERVPWAWVYMCTSWGNLHLLLRRLCWDMVVICTNQDHFKLDFLLFTFCELCPKLPWVLLRILKEISFPILHTLPNRDRHISLLFLSMKWSGCYFVYIILFYFLNKLHFYSSFRHTAKLTETTEIVSYAPCPPRARPSPHLTSPTRAVHVLQSVSLHWHIVITWSP